MRWGLARRQEISRAAVPTGATHRCRQRTRAPCSSLTLSYLGLRSAQQHTFGEWPLSDSISLPGSQEEAPVQCRSQESHRFLTMARAARALEPLHPGASQWGAGAQTSSRGPAQRDTAGPGRAEGEEPIAVRAHVPPYFCPGWTVAPLLAGHGMASGEGTVRESLNKTEVLKATQLGPTGPTLWSHTK